MIKYKALLLLSLSAEWFDHSSSLTFKKYLPVPNQLHVWTGYLQSKEYQGGNSKVGWWLLFSNSIGRMVGLDGLFQYKKILKPNIMT